MNNRRVSHGENITSRSSSKKKAIASIKGVDMHIQRIMDAKRKKIEEAQAFLLPSQKAKLKQL